MKRVISLILALLMTVSLLPAVHAGTAPAVSSNIDDHFYINAGRYYHPIYSNLAWENGQYVRAEAIDDGLVVEYYDQNFQYLSGKTIELELPIFGGVRMDTDYNFVVVGQDNPNEDDSVEVFRIIRYTKDWQRVDHASLFGANTYIPFDAGSLRFDRSGDMLYIRTSHEMYADENGINHQANVMIAVRISDMTVTDELTKVWNSGYGYVSHSFNQFVRVDGDKLLAVDHGDALPRSVCLFKYPYSASSETFYGRTTMVNALPIVDSTYHYNDTGVSVGGFEFSSTDYLIAGCSYDQTVETDLMYAHRNIFVTATPKNNFTDEATEVHWLTSFTEADGVTVSPPHLVKLDADRFFLTWTENDVLKYCFLDGKGQLDGSIKTGTGALSDCVPIPAGNRVVWYVTDNSAPEFYTIQTAPCPHSYASAVTAPTCTEQGFTTYTCSLCGESYVGDYTDALGHDETAVVTDPTCTEQGFTTYTCARCGESRVGDYKDALGHQETLLPGQEATCTEPGLTDGSTCSSCGMVIQAQTEIPALGHDLGDFVITVPVGCFDDGLETAHCSRCDYTEERVIEATGHDFTEWFEEWPATCTEHGGLARVCNRCQFKDTKATQPLGHSYDEGVVTTEPTETSTGILTYTCTREGCGATYTEVIPELGHEHTPELTGAREATCTDDGYTGDMVCTGCGEILEKGQVIAAPGHAYGKWVLESYPSAESSGMKSITCSVCGEGASGGVMFPEDPHPNGHAIVIYDSKYSFTATNITAAEPGHHVFLDIDPDDGYYVEAIYYGSTSEDVVIEEPRFYGQYLYFTMPDGELHVQIVCRANEDDGRFQDVDPESFYYEPFLWALENGITNGIDATHFGPGVDCNRAQVVTFLWRAAGEPEPTTTKNPFVDVEEDAFYYKAVLWAVENGITNGLDETHFGPGVNCNRAQVVTFLWRSMGCPSSGSDRSPFTDVKAGEFYDQAVLWAVENGITNGMSDTEFGINAICNRAQIVTFLYRTFA